MLHCTATEAGREVTPDEIISWHTTPKSSGGRGWKRVGYLGMWLLDGTFHEFYEDNDDEFIDSWEVTNGAYGWNLKAKHYVYAGGLRNGIPYNTMTYEQEKAMAEFFLGKVPGSRVKMIGHNQVNKNKSCPGLDVSAWSLKIGIPIQNIDFNYYY